MCLGMCMSPVCPQKPVRLSDLLELEWCKLSDVHDRNQTLVLCEQRDEL